MYAFVLIFLNIVMPSLIQLMQFLNLPTDKGRY